MKRSLWSELQRRQVPKAAAGYAVSRGWLLAGRRRDVRPLGIPAWVSACLVVASILGFPLVVTLGGSLT